MSGKENSTAPVFLAAVPVLFMARSWQMALQAGAVLAAGFLLAGLFFTFFSSWFPPRLVRTAYMMGLAALAQLFFHVHEYLVFGVIGIHFLMPPEIFQPSKSKEATRRLFLCAFLFAGLLGFLGAFQDVLGLRFGVGAFQLPAGSFLLLFMTAALWQAQPAAARVSSAQPAGGHGESI